MENQLTLTSDMQLVLGLTVLTMVLFLFERLRADVVALVVLVLLGLTGLVEPGDLFNGFASNAVMSVIATMILGAGLDRTGALNRLAGWLLRRARGAESRLLLFTSAIAGLNSSVMQNPSVMALYLPVAVMLIGLIVRGVAFDFRVKARDAHKAAWNHLFALGSLVTTLAQGWMLGRYITGLRPDGQDDAFAALIALSLAACYALLGACWLILKTEDALQERAIAWAKRCWPAVVLGLLAISVATPWVSASVRAKWFSLPDFFALLPIPLMSAVALLSLRGCAEQDDTERLRQASAVLRAAIEAEDAGGDVAVEKQPAIEVLAQQRPDAVQGGQPERPIAPRRRRRHSPPECPDSTHWPDS